MKRKLFILWLMLLVGAAGARAAEAYTYFDPSDGSLNFCYDSNRAAWKSSGFTTYSLNTGSNTPDWYSIRSSVKELYFYSAFADYRPTSCYRWADGMTNLTKLSYIGRLNTSQVTNMAYMFKDCSKLTSLDLNWTTFVTSRVTDMSYMFDNCSGLEYLDIGNFNTSNVTSMAYMFYGCSKLSSLNVSSFNTSKVTNMMSMFQKCSSLESLNVSNFNTAEAAKGWMSSMFAGCTSLTSLDLSSFTIGYNNYMLENCSSLEYLKISGNGSWYSTACRGVGEDWPCTLDYPNGYNPVISGAGSDYYGHTSFSWCGGEFDFPEPEFVDLGLSVQWCDRNLGADSREKYGFKYAWGESDTKSTYTWANYAYANGSASTVKNIGSNISADEYYDAAFSTFYYYQGYGIDETSYHCLPTKAQWNELVTKCTFKETTVNGVKGYTVTGPNGKSIFLPYSGYSADGQFVGNGTSAYYWSGDIDASNSQKANALYIKSGTKNVTTIQRRTGSAIRPVRYSPNTKPDPLELVDLGLSVKWCNMDLNALHEGNYGSYYAWGETDTKTTYTWANYKHASGSATTVKNIGADIQYTNYDAAHDYGTAYTDYTQSESVDICMPTKDQWNELISRCTFKETTVDGKKGYKVTGPNGASIFLPYSGYSADGKTVGQGTSAYYWTSEMDGSNTQKANAFYIKSGSKSVTTIQRRTGAAVRAVEYVETPGTAYELELVDLGLSVRWCNKNVYSTEPEKYGQYYAWGETSTKNTFTWANYKYANGTAATVKNIGSNIAVTDYDAAYNYRSVWEDNGETDICMPTKAQWDELISKCTFKSTTVNGVAGYRVTGPSGKSIFLPYSGYSADGQNVGQGSSAYYWSSEVDPSNAQKASALYIKSDGTKKTTVIQRRTGAAIRGVEYIFVDNIEESTLLEETPTLVDLGLSVKWSDYNLTDNNVVTVVDHTRNGEQVGYFDTGNYYAWGETDEKSTYTWANYKHASGTATTVKNIGSNIQGTNYDVLYEIGEAYDPVAKKNKTLCLPTKAQWEELLSKCTFKASSYGVVKGYTVTGPSGKSIFLPLTGYKADGQFNGEGTSAYYWTANVDASNAQKANAFYITSSGTKKMSVAQRRTGAVVRGVEYVASTPPSTTHEYVDLGLTSKTLWATCNVGATAPEGYSNYYAWGETKTKSTYNWTTYQYCNGTSSSVVNIGTDIAGTSYDAATKEWGSGWVMPSVVQITELLNQCKMSLATVNNVKGLRFTGPNGKSIFVPMTGYKVDATLYKAGEQTYLWSYRKDLVTNVAYKAGALYLERSSTSAKTKSTQAQRRTGSPVRAVRASSAGANEGMFETDGILAAPVTTPADDAIYNLQGMKMEGELQPGIYVKNGKKYEVK